MFDSGIYRINYEFGFRNISLKVIHFITELL